MIIFEAQSSGNYNQIHRSNYWKMIILENQNKQNTTEIS